MMTMTQLSPDSPLAPGQEYLMHRLFEDGSALVVAYLMTTPTALDERFLVWATLGALTPDGWSSWGAMDRPALARLRGQRSPQPVRVVIHDALYSLTHRGLPGLIPLDLMDRGRQVADVVYSMVENTGDSHE